MSRNAPISARKFWFRGGLAVVAAVAPGLAQAAGPTNPAPATAILAPASLPARVVVAHDPAATEAFVPRLEKVREMTRHGLRAVTGKSSVTDAWRSLVTPQDVVGIKVFSSPGSGSGTRPAVVMALIETLLEARHPASNILVWDKHRADLRQAGFFEFTTNYGVRVDGSANAGYDEGTFYNPDQPLLGQLNYGDLEFGRKGEGVGRRSFVSRLVAHGMTKIINVTPLLNHNSAGVCGHLYSLAMGSVDNTLRFETESDRLATAVPEIFALPVLADRVVLNITDALICQYHGEQRMLLHYSAALNELRFSKDPVALDLLSLLELDRQRQVAKNLAASALTITNHLELIQNAGLLELGASEMDGIKVERVP